MMSDAYIDGFCKVAEEFGVDPVALAKAAGFRDAAARVAGRVFRLKKTTPADMTKQVVDKGLSLWGDVDTAKDLLGKARRLFGV